MNEDAGKDLAIVTDLIRVVRGERVMLDEDLSRLYKVETRTLNQAVTRNIERFPEDFMFTLTAEEDAALRSQIVILKAGRGQHRKHATRAFTEQGVAMLSSVLRSPRAVQVNIEIMRAFVRMRRMVTGYESLVRKVDALESKYDAQFKAVFDAIRAMIRPPAKPRRVAGFRKE